MEREMELFKRNKQLIVYYQKMYKKIKTEIRANTKEDSGMLPSQESK